MDHYGSAKFAISKREEIFEKIRQVQDTGDVTFADSEYLKDAVDQVIECRRILKNCCIYSFFLADDDMGRGLFEHHQKMLQEHTETLHGYTELDPASIEVGTLMNYVHTGRTFIDSLVKYLADKELM